LQLSCRNIQDKICDLNDAESEKRKLEVQIKVPIVLKEFVEKLIEKLELMKLIIQELGKQHANYQQKFTETQSLVNNQQRTINQTEKRNREIECKVNEKIRKMRESFLRKWAELNPSRVSYEAIADELCTKRKDLEAQVNHKKCLFNQLLLAIKSLQPKKVAESKIAKQKLEKLQQQQEKLLKRFTNLTAAAECVQSKIAAVQREMDIIRKFTMGKMEVVKQLEDWNVKHLEAKQQQLLDELKNYNTAEDEAIVKLSRGICATNSKIKEANKTISRLRRHMQQLTKRDSSCRIAAEAEAPLTVECRIQPLVMGHDYMGSAFVMLLEAPQQPVLATDYSGSTFVAMV